MIVKSNCHYCGYLCGFLATVEDGKLVDLAPDPSRYPYDPSIVKSCRRWRMNLDAIDGQDRIDHPLKRIGQRGHGKWERVSWDEALDEIARRLQELVEKYGPGTVASAIGGPHATYWPLHRFMNTLGSPNNMGIGQICWNPRIWVQSLTFGWPIESDVDLQQTGAVFLWATNPAVSDNSLFWRTLREVSDSGTPLVVIDPRLTETAKVAELHLAPFPATDCTLALGLIHQIIATDSIDHDFVSNWCYGYEGLVAHVERYTPEYVEDVTGVPAEDVCRAAEIFAKHGPTALISGRGIDQLGPNTLPTIRAISILRAITGNVDRKGACVINMMSDFIPEIDMEMSYYHMPDNMKALQLNAPYSPLQSYDGWDGAIELTWKLGKRLPMRYLTSAHPNLVWRAMVTGQPYPVRALIAEAANPLITYADTNLVYEAISNLDLLVVLEYYMTPTAQMADFVLPAAAAFERPLFQAQGGVANVAYGGGAAVEPYYERHCDYDFFRDLGLRMGQQDTWPQESLEEALDVQMSTTNMDWNTFCDRGIYFGRSYYGKHEIVNQSTGNKLGFATTTGKVELRNEYLISLGATEYPEPVPIDDATDRGYAHDLGLATRDDEVIGAAGSTPRVRCGTTDAGSRDPNVMRMITGARMQPYWASSYFNNPKFRKTHPYPTASMNARTLRDAGLEPGDWVQVSTSKGKARFMAAEAAMVDGVVSVEYGWWYPEDEQSEPVLGGMWKSNVNVLTSGDIETSESLIGTWKYNGILCRVEKCANR